MRSASCHDTGPGANDPIRILNGTGPPIRSRTHCTYCLLRTHTYRAVCRAGAGAGAAARPPPQPSVPWPSPSPTTKHTEHRAAARIYQTNPSPAALLSQTPTKISSPHLTAMAVASASASASAPRLAATLSSNPAARSSPAFLPLPLRPRVAGLVVTGRRERFRAEATTRTRREKEEQEIEVAAVEESFPVRGTGAPEGAADDDDDLLAPTEEEGWVVRLEQSFNIFLTDSIIMILDGLYRDRDYARFFVLETIARVPYFAFISVLHMYETFGWWRRADYIKVHFAESMNEFHHLLIMEELGGNSVWIDRFLARFSAFFYYFMTVAMYMLSPRMAYHFSECVERHAYSTYDKFLKLHGEELKNLPAPEAAINYYMNEDLYLFDEFQTSRVPCSRRPKVDNLYDVFVNIRDDEAEHCKTMKACQTHGNLRSPHSMQNRIENDTECVIPENDCEGIMDCVKKSLASED